VEGDEESLVRHSLAADASCVALETIADVRLEHVTDYFGSVPPGELDDGRMVFQRRVRVVDDDRAAFR
jgi:hypothetical protein